MAVWTYRSEARMNELVGKANKALVKAGMPQIVIQSVTPRTVPDGLNAWGEPKTKVVYDAELTLPQQICRIEGQEVIARLNRVEDLNMVTRINGYDGDLERFQTAALECDHCKTNRRRKGSWVVIRETGEKVQIGDTCVDVYFGVDVEAVLRTSERIHGFLGDCEDEDGPRQREANLAAEFATAVAYLTATKGFVTRKAAGDGGVSTSDDAQWIVRDCTSIDPRIRAEHQEENAKLSAWVGQNPNTATRVLDWWMEQEPKSEFEHNCKVAVLSQSMRWAGILAFAVKIWHDQNAPKPQPKVNASNDWIGQVGEKVQVSVTVKNMRGIDGTYGTTTLLNMEDENGNVITWFASNNPGLSLGETYRLKGTVKKLDEFKGRKQTVLTRCSIG